MTSTKEITSTPPLTAAATTTTTIDDHITQKLYECTGEYIHDLGTPEAPLETADFLAQYHSLEAAASKQDCDLTILSHTAKGTKHSAELLIRRRGLDCLSVPTDDDATKIPRRTFTEVRVCVTGNVDSGKSTMLGVLTHGTLDDGRGSARLRVFRHQHEASTGRTSSISHGSLGFNSASNIVTYSSTDKFGSQKGATMNTSITNSLSAKSDDEKRQIELMSNPDSQLKKSDAGNSGDSDKKVAKLVTFVDLAGHERYLKTTMFGMTGHQPDYAMLMIGANMGVVGMTKEHLGVAAALRLPFFLVITKTDICPANVFKSTLDQIKKVIRSLGGKKVPYMVKSMGDVIFSARKMLTNSIVPVFCTSSVTGLRIDLLRAFLNLLPSTQPWDSRLRDPAELIVDTDWSVQGVGTVLSGTLTHGTLTLATSASLMLGPDPHGRFASVGIKSIFVNGAPAERAFAGQSCSVALRKVARRDVREGMRLVSAEKRDLCACYEFDAEVMVLYHSTTIAPGYEAVVHCANVKQTAKLVGIEGGKTVLRTGDKARVRFRFLRYPECVVPGTRIIFREGKAKGIGKVVDVTKYVPAIGAEDGDGGAGGVKGKGKGKKPRVRGRSSSSEAVMTTSQ